MASKIVHEKEVRVAIADIHAQLAYSCGILHETHKDYGVARAYQEGRQTAYLQALKALKGLIHE